MTSLGTVDKVLRPLILGLLIWCLSLSLLLIVDQFAQGGWKLAYLPPFCAATAVEACFSFGILKRAGAYAHWSRFRLPEFAGLFVALQLCVDVANSQAPFAGDMPRFDGQTVVLAIPVLLAWVVATDAARDLSRLEEPPENDPLHAGTLRRLSTRFFWGGLALFIATGLSQPALAHKLGMPESSVAAPLLNVLLYFLAGMLLLGRVRYATLAQRWRSRQVTVAAGLDSRWMWYSLAFLGLVLLVALLLPTSRTVGLITVGQAVWNVLFDLFWGPLTRLLAHLGGPLPRVRPRVIPTLPVHLPHQPPKHGPVHHSGGGSSWGHIVQALFFWAVVAAGAVYLIRTFMQSRMGGTGRTLGRLAAVLGAIGKVWEALTRRLRRFAGALGDRIPERLTVRRAPGAPLRSLLPFTRRRGPLSSREQVLRYYLNVVQGARRRGIARNPSQTPREFSAVLAPRLPEAGEDMHDLTEAFVDARYSLHPVNDAEASEAHGWWQHVRAALRRVQ